MPKKTPILIDEDQKVVVDKMPRKPTNFGKTRTVRPHRERKKLNWNRFIEFNLDDTKGKIRFIVTYMLVGLGFILASDVFRLVHLKTTGGFMVFFGIMAIIGAIVVPVIKLIQENEDRENERRRKERESRRWPQ